MRSFEFFKLFYENFKKTIANFAYMWYTFSCSLKAITALVTENAVKLTDEVGFSHKLLYETQKNRVYP